MTEYKYADRISNMKDTAMYMRGFFDNMNDPEMRSFGGGAPYSTSMDEMLYSMVREGIGVMFSTELMAPASRSEGIVSLPIYPDHYRTLGYYVKDPARLSSAAAAFIEATKRIVNA